MGKGSQNSRTSAIAWALKMAWEINRTLLITVFVLVAILSILPAISLYFNREVIAQLSNFLATGQGSFDEVLHALLIYGVLLALITLSARINADFVAGLTDDIYAYGMQERLINAVHDFELLDLMRRNVNEDFNYIVRQSHALNKVIGGVCSIGGKVFLIASLCVVAWSLSRPVLAITLVYVVVVCILSFRFGRGARFSFSKFRKAEVKAQYLQNMPMESNIAKEIRVYECAEGIIASWRNAYAQRLDMEITRFKATEVQSFVLGATFYFFLTLVIAVMLVQVVGGSATPAILLTVFTLCTNLFSSMSTLSRDLITFDDNLFRIEQQRALLFDQGDKKVRSKGESANEVAATRDAPNEKLQENQVQRVSSSHELDVQRENVPVFSARNLSFSYNGKHRVLEDIHLDIVPGEVIALIGENGSGKSTLVKLLMGIFPPLDGELLFYGRPYDECSPGELGRKIGGFFQDFYLFHHTLAENVAYGDVDSIDNRDKVNTAIERGGASRVLAKLPKGIDTVLGKRIDKEGVELSGGERQLIAMARAYMNDKDVLIFDEPASMLDPLAEIDQFRTIRSRIGEKTGILISHRVGFARLADRIIMMDCGRIAEVGTHEELVAKEGLYAAFFREQAQWYKPRPAQEEDACARNEHPPCQEGASA